jgi:Na+-transporting methylmalonyl-CoA/oxaloacetate decarboxylase beta subunit
MMTLDRNAARELFSGLAIALLLLGSTLAGEIVFALALGLLAVGIVAFPEARRGGILAATVAAGLAGTAVLILEP